MLVLPSPGTMHLKVFLSQSSAQRVTTMVIMADLSVINAELAISATVWDSLRTLDPSAKSVTTVNPTTHSLHKRMPMVLKLSIAKNHVQLAPILIKLPERRS